MPPVIQITNLSKIYRLGEIGTGTISHDLERWYKMKIRGLEDPFLKIGEANDRSTKGKSDVVYSLRDINFEIQQGEAIGIIGKNGAGKSTLLKILSRVTSPTTGRIHIKGRVASLLEVGTGFHPELTGRENIFLNGAILGMRKKEITRKLDEIINFSGVERYIDTPVKRFSSGMYVRLAFAVAAHLESEIMIVDEVLAVGDAEFQKKCLGKMGEVGSGEGRTVIFVSHNMLAVKSLCSSGILMSDGIIQSQGEMSKVIETYIATNKSSSFSIIEKESSGFVVHSVTASNNGIDGNFDIEDDLEIMVEVSSNMEFEQIKINLYFNTADGALIFATRSPFEKFEKGRYLYKCVIPAKTLNDNMYIIDMMVLTKGTIALHDIKEILTLQGHEEIRIGDGLGKFPGLIRPQNLKWTKQKSIDKF